MALTAATVLFLVFFANVLLGAFADARFLGDVGEMLFLFAASVTFVAAILKREATETSGPETKKDSP